jgi:methylmalonyl-CoA mutase N-terminal domain/subunit
MTINATASILLALYVAVARRQGADIRLLSGTVQNDVLKEYIARGTYIYPPQQAMRIITDLFSWANQNVPEWNTISISGYHMREAGSGVHAGQRDRLRAGCDQRRAGRGQVRAAPFVLLQCA